MNKTMGAKGKLKYQLIVSTFEDVENHGREIVNVTPVINDSCCCEIDECSHIVVLITALVGLIRSLEREDNRPGEVMKIVTEMIGEEYVDNNYLVKKTEETIFPKAENEQINEN